MWGDSEILALSSGSVAQDRNPGCFSLDVWRLREFEGRLDVAGPLAGLRQLKAPGGEDLQV